MLSENSECETDVVGFLQLEEKLCTLLDPSELAVKAIIMRQLWFRRNAFVFENSFLHPQCFG